MKYHILLMMLLSLTSSLFSMRTWEAIKDSGELKIAIRIRQGVMEKNKKTGLHFELIQQFCGKNDLKLRYQIKKNISDYFTDDVFKDVDVVVDNLTITSDRGKKMNFVPILPVKQIIVTKKNHKTLSRLSDLSDQTIIVTKGSSYYENLQKKQKLAGFDFKYFFSSSTSKQMDDLLASKGTATILDANIAAMNLIDNNIQLHRAISSSEEIAWGVAKGNNSLKKELDAYIKEAQKSGLFVAIWDKYIEGISYSDYLKISQIE